LPAGSRPGEPGNAENRVLKRVGDKLDFMKKLFVLLFISTFFLGTLTSQVTVEAFPMEPQSGQYNYFGVRVTLPQTYGADVVVTGYIYDDGSPDTNHPFSLTVTSGNLTAETADNFYQTSPAENAAAEISTIGTTYAGVSIIFEVNANILKFASFSDINVVLNQLDDDYEDNYDNYDSQLDTSLSVEVLDSLDEVNGFDSRITFRNFENLFPGYNSKRAEIEGIESTWLYNNLSGTHPGDIDLTYDDAQNTVSNTDYSFKIGNDLYQITSAGIYINGVLQDDEGWPVAKTSIKGDGIFTNKFLHDHDFHISGPLVIENDDDIINDNFQEYGSDGLQSMTVCKSNKKDHHGFKYENETKMFEVEVAIHSVFYRGGIHGKVIHFKKKANGNWKRSRAQMAAGCGGKVYSGNCTFLDQPILRKPTNGFKKREEQKAKLHSEFQIPGNNTIWKTYSGELGASFDSPVGYGVWTLYF